MHACEYQVLYIYILHYVQFTGEERERERKEENKRNYATFATEAHVNVQKQFFKSPPLFIGKGT